jgi:hypothetical protein
VDGPGSGSPPDLPGGGSFGNPFDGIPWLPSILLTSFSAIGGIVLFAFLASRPRRRMEAVSAGPMDLIEAPAPTGQPALIAMAAAAVPDTPYQELGMPRWRRPSLQAARKASTRDIPDHVPMMFAAPADAAIRRARVTYRLVRAYDQPDEIRGVEVAWLDRGDEVEIVAEQGRYAFVRTSTARPVGCTGRRSRRSTSGRWPRTPSGTSRARRRRSAFVVDHPLTSSLTPGSMWSI